TASGDGGRGVLRETAYARYPFGGNWIPSPSVREWAMRYVPGWSLAACPIGVVIAAASGATPPRAETRPDLNGTRVRAPGQATVFLIDNGFRRAVPHVPAYEALFRDWECIVEDIDVESIRLGDPLGEGSCLVRPVGQ